MSPASQNAPRSSPAWLLLGLLWAAASLGSVRLAALPGGFAWLLVLALLAASALSLGRAATGAFAGIITNAQNLASLARLQAVLWLLLILSAYLVAAASRRGHGELVSVVIDPSLVLVLALAATSLLAEPLLNLRKRRLAPQPGVAAAAARALSEDEAAVAANARGILYGRAATSHPVLLDLLRGDELEDAHALDLTKVQLLLTTASFAAPSLVALYGALAQPAAGAAVAHLPGPGMAAGILLAISHAVFIGGRLVRHTAIASDAPVVVARGAQETDKLSRMLQKVRALERASRTQARTSESMDESLKRIVSALTDRQRRADEQLADAAARITESLDRLKEAQRSEGRGLERILDAARRLEDSVRLQERIAKQLARSAGRTGPFDA